MFQQTQAWPLPATRTTNQVSAFKNKSWCLTYKAIQHDGQKLCILLFTQHFIRTSTDWCKHNDVEGSVLFMQELYCVINCQKTLRSTQPFSDMWLDLAENNGWILSQTAKDNKTPMFVNMPASYTADGDWAKSVVMDCNPKGAILHKGTVQLLHQHPFSTNICCVIKNLSKFVRINSNLKHRWLRANKLCVHNKRSKSIIIFSLLIQYHASSLKCIRINIEKHLVASSRLPIPLYQIHWYWKFICEIWQPTGDA